MKNIFKALVVVMLSQFFLLASYAGEDGTKTLSNSNKPVKDCFEKIKDAFEAGHNTGQQDTDFLTHPFLDPRIINNPIAISIIEKEILFNGW